MSTENTKKVVVSFPVFGILGIIFVILKVTGFGLFATLPWVWVLSPFWIPFVLAFCFFAIFLVFALIALIIAAIANAL